MKFNFIRNIQFTKLIKIQGRLKEFNFRKGNPTVKGFFTVDVLDDAPQGNRIIFQMEKKDTKWKILQQNLPSWIIEKEEEFDQLINEELKQIE